MSELGEFLPSQAPAGEATGPVVPLMVTAEPTPEMTETERELVKRLRTGRAALPVLPQVAESALRLANDPDARISVAPDFASNSGSRSAGTRSR